MDLFAQRSRFQWIGLALGIAVGALLLVSETSLQDHGNWGARPARAAAVATLMAIWWLSEALPIYATACVPVVLFPLLGVFGPDLGSNFQETLLPYVDPYIFLFAGGMGIAAAMQHWNLHRRIALTILNWIGADPRRVLAGFLVATAAISLWISNTATATMMMPIGMAVITQLESQAGRRLAHFGMAIMLAVAYGANVGGIGTKIGTAPNAQFSGFVAQLGIDISFLQFMAVGLPFVLLFLPLLWFMLWRIARHDSAVGTSAAAVVLAELRQLGKIQRAERIVLAVFATAAGLWIAGKPLTNWLAGYVTQFKLTTAHVEGGIALLAALLLMLLKSRGQTVLPLRALRHVPWETLLLLGGGFSMAAGIQKSGLSDWAAGQLLALRGLPSFSQVLLAAVTTVAISAVASNTATIAVMLVVLKDVVADPALLPTVLFAATISASCDFALPAGTPPNAIVFGSGYVTIPRMARTGVVLDLAAAVLAASWCWVAVRWVL